MSAKRTIWFLSKERLGPIRMSPAIRMMEMAKASETVGGLPILVPEGGAGFAAPMVCADHAEFLRRWRPGDAVILDAYLPTQRLWDILSHRIPFDLDLYCTSAPEASQSASLSSDWRQVRARRQHILGYAFAIAAAERIYVSTAGQIPMLCGSLYHSSYFPAVQASADLPARSLVLPMGVPTFPATLAPQPYPTELHGRPVFLWGGGIWDWFDTETVLQAFARLPDPDSGPALFFLSASNHRPDAMADSPVRRATQRAQALGILGRNVFFNDRAVGPQELPAYVQNACAGVMANPPSWEAGISWRTRFLDLLAAGKPLVVAGNDPLGQRMAEAGAAIAVPAGDAEAMNRALLDCATRPHEFEPASLKLGQKLSWSRVLEPWLSRIADPSSFADAPPPPSPLWRLRHRIGL